VKIKKSFFYAAGYFLSRVFEFLFCFFPTNSWKYFENEGNDFGTGLANFFKLDTERRLKPSL